MMPKYEIKPSVYEVTGICFSVFEDGHIVKHFYGWKDGKKHTVAAAYQEAKDWIEQRKEMHELAESVMELD